jgi:hypothetical protein
MEVTRDLQQRRVREADRWDQLELEELFAEDQGDVLRNQNQFDQFVRTIEVLPNQVLGACYRMALRDENGLPIQPGVLGKLFRPILYTLYSQQLVKTIDIRDEVPLAGAGPGRTRRRRFKLVLTIQLTILADREGEADWMYASSLRFDGFIPEINPMPWNERFENDMATIALAVYDRSVTAFSFCFFYEGRNTQVLMTELNRMIPGFLLRYIGRDRGPGTARQMVRDLTSRGNRPTNFNIAREYCNKINLVWNREYGPLLNEMQWRLEKRGRQPMKLFPRRPVDDEQAEQWVRQMLPQGGCQLHWSHHQAVRECGIFRVRSHKSEFPERVPHAVQKLIHQMESPDFLNNCFFAELGHVMCQRTLARDRALPLRKKVLGQSYGDPAILSKIDLEHADCIARHLSINLEIKNPSGETLLKAYYAQRGQHPDNEFIPRLLLILDEEAEHYLCPIGYVQPEGKTASLEYYYNIPSREEYLQNNRKKETAPQRPTKVKDTLPITISLEEAKQQRQKNAKAKELSTEISVDEEEETEDVAMEDVGEAERPVEEVLATETEWDIHQMAIFDLETGNGGGLFDEIDDPKGGRHWVYLAGIYYKGSILYFRGETCMEQLVEWLYRQSESILLVGFNNCNFDNFFLLEAIVSYHEKHGFLPTAGLHTTDEDSGAYIQRLLMAGNRLLSFEFGPHAGIKHAVLDLKQMIGPGSLDSCCKSFKLSNEDSKSVFPHKVIVTPNQLLESPFLDRPLTRSDFFEHTFNKPDSAREAQELIEQSEREPLPIQRIADAYLAQDLKATYALVEIMQEMFQSVFDVNMFSFQTYSQIAYKLFLESVDLKRVHTFKLGRHYDNIRKAYYGGMTYPSCHYWQSSDYIAGMPYDEVHDFLEYLDANSLYPAVMKGKEYPIDSVKYIEYKLPYQYIPESFVGIAFVTYTPNKNLCNPILPTRTKTGLLWTLEDEVHGAWYTTVDLDFAAHAGYAIHVNACYVWSATEKLFDTYLDKSLSIKDQGTREKNPSKRLCGKLFSNCLYGKTGQREYHTTSHLIRSRDAFVKLTRKMSGKVTSIQPVQSSYVLVVTEEDVTYKYAKRPHYLAAFITAESRVLMLKYLKYMNPYFGKDIMQSLNHTSLYMDTDSVFCRNREAELLRFSGMCDPSELGKLKNELGDSAKIVEFWCIAPKCYKMKTVQADPVTGQCIEHVEFRAKGLPLEKVEALDRALAEEDRDLFWEMVEDARDFLLELEPHIVHAKPKVGLPYKRTDCSFKRTLNKTSYSGRLSRVYPKDHPLHYFSVPRGSCWTTTINTCSCVLCQKNHTRPSQSSPLDL